MSGGGGGGKKREETEAADGADKCRPRRGRKSPFSGLSVSAQYSAFL